MKTIWKFELLDIEDAIAIDMPEGAEILTVQEQRGKSCLWALVDPEANKEQRMFCIHGTGHPVNGSNLKKYIGTYQLMEGALVFHLFEFKLLEEVE